MKINRRFQIQLDSILADSPYRMFHEKGLFKQVCAFPTIKISGCVSSMMVARYFLSQVEILRANCPEKKSQGQTVPSRNPEGKLSLAEILRATVPSRNPEGKLSQAEIPRASCPKQKS